MSRPTARGVALAPPVFVPLGTGLVATPAFDGAAGQAYALAAWLQPVGAALVLASITLLSGTAAVIAAAGWLPVTGLLGVAALARVRERGPWPLAELVADAGLAYTNVAAVALVSYQLGVFFWFEPVIVLLTFVHFNYAGFVLAVVTALAGRVLSERAGRGYRALAVVVLGGPGLIGLGISFSPVVEVLAVGAFTVAVAALAGYLLVRVVPERPRRQGMLLAVSALALPGSMLLALGYGVAAFTGTNPLWVDISTMVAVHGSLNAFGFALCGLVGWRLAVPGSERF